MALANTGSGAALNLAEFAGDDLDALNIGDLAVVDGDLYYTADSFGDGTSVTSIVSTYVNAYQIIPIIPQRAVDTRNAAGRARILNHSALDGEGRVIGGKTIYISLASGSETDYEYDASAAFCNLTVDAPVGPGYATLFPGGNPPETSSVNFAKGQTIANFAVVGITEGEYDDDDTVSVYVHTTAHIILDITAFSASILDVNPAYLPEGPDAADALGQAKKKSTRKAPKWRHASR